MDVDREKFLKEGYIILPGVIPPDMLEDLRSAYEIMVERQKVIWERERGPDDPPGGVWETHSQPQINLGAMADQIDAETASTVEIWLQGNMQGVSSVLLGVDDAAVTEMGLMCNPTRDHGSADHRGWHRDFYPPRCAPLQSYAEDIIENGPRYVQWNLPLYDDDVLWVVPESHIRFNTEEEDTFMSQDPRRPLPGGVQTHLKAGDGVAYITPILHWGSNYDTVMRRTIHGGFSNFTLYKDLNYLEHLSGPSRENFERWARRSEEMQDQTESTLRAAIDKNGAAYHAGLDNLHQGRGGKGKFQSTIFLSKVDKRINQLKRPGFEDLSDLERQWATIVHPMTFQWGGAFAERFSPEEAQVLWERFRPVDEGLQAEEEGWAPGFQGEESRYYFNQVPDNISLESLIDGWGG